jgi:D-serine deaminase-like pyridoxal phosphate-dependent protein
VGSTADWSTKGLWLPEPGDVVGRQLFDDTFSWPAMVIRRSAIEANIATMAAYCARHGLELAPHGKTTMVPALFEAQLRAGAWGITVATANQALTARRLGVPRVLLANELLDAKVLRWAAEQVAAGWEFLYYVDSPAGVAVLRDALAGTDLRLRVLVEMGFGGGRTGCRTVEEAVEVASSAARVPAAWPGSPGL